MYALASEPGYDANGNGMRPVAGSHWAMPVQVN